MLSSRTVDAVVVSSRTKLDEDDVVDITSFVALDAAAMHEEKVVVVVVVAVFDRIANVVANVVVDVVVVVVVVVVYVVAALVAVLVLPLVPVEQPCPLCTS